MTIDRKTAQQFADAQRTALLARTRRYDTGFGPIPDVVINPLAAVLEDLNNNGLRRVSLLLSLSNPNEFTEDDLNATVFNEDILRPIGSNATAVLTFSRSRPFGGSESGLIPRGYPVGTTLDESTGQAVTFVTTVSKDKTSAVAMLDTTTNSTVYQVQVPTVCLIKGSAGAVGPDRINLPLRPLVGWDSVTNTTATQEGVNRYTNSQLIELYLLAVSSRQLSVATGEEFYVRDNFANVADVHEVFGVDPLLTRAATDAGAVDAFIVGQDLLTITDAITFLGISQKLVVKTPPVVSINSVSRLSDGFIFFQGIDYTVALDSTGISGSTRGLDGIRFLPGAAASLSAAAATALTPGDTININYSYNQLIIDLQATTTDPEVAVDGRDLLFRMGTQVEIFLTCTIKVLTGFTPSTIQLAVAQTITNTINVQKLGQSVEVFNIETAVGQISGVSNFTITNIARTATGVGTGDVTINGNEYSHISATNLTVTPT